MPLTKAMSTWAYRNTEERNNLQQDRASMPARMIQEVRNMTKADMIRKLTSRKLWVAVAGFVAGMVVAFSGESTTAETVSGLILQGGAVVSYILAEGWTDAAHTEG